MGIEPKLQINNTNSKKSNLGGFISLIIYILSILGVFYFGQELVFKRKPNVVSSNSYDASPQIYNITKDKFNFFIGIQDSNYNYYYDPSIFTLKAYFNKFTNYGLNETNTVIRMEPCDLQRHFGDNTNLFLNIDFTGIVCPNPDDLNQVDFQGAFGTELFDTLIFYVSKCKNSTLANSTVCKPIKDIQSALSGGYFVVDYLDNIFDHSNYTTPQNRIRRDYFTVMSYQYNKELYLYFDNIDYVTDQGFLIESDQINRTFTFSYSTELLDLRESDDYFFFMQMRLSYFRTVYKRSYVKIQDVVAQVGGMIKGIVFIFSVIFSPFLTTNYFQHIINQSYNYDYFSKTVKTNFSKTNVIESQNILISSNKQITNLFKNTRLKTFKTTTDLDVVKKIINYKKNNINRIDFTFLEKLKLTFYFCLGYNKFSKQNLQFYVKSTDNINSSLDVVNIFKAKQDIQALQNLLLEDRHNIILPLVSNYKEQDSDVNDVRNIADALIQIKIKESENNIDSKLSSQVNDIIQFIESC